MVNKNLLSRLIIFSNVIPWSFSQNNLTEFLFVALFFINDLNGYYTHSVVSVVFVSSMLVFLKHNFSRKKKLFVGIVNHLIILIGVKNVFLF